MGSIPEIASAILSQSEQRVEFAAQNVANLTTPGYKRRIYFDKILSSRGLDETPGAAVATGSATDFTQGKLVNTGSPYDLAIEGEGFFVVRTPADQLLYTRQGQFHLDEDGHLATTSGLVLQSDGGGDLTLHGGEMKVAEDGLMTEAGEPVARVGIAAFADPSAVTPAGAGAFSVSEGQTSTVARPSVRQGALEASNVSTGDEMVSIMEALRRAEAGQRLVSLYDDLMGQALQTFGQA